MGEMLSSIEVHDELFKLNDKTKYRVKLNLVREVLYHGGNTRHIGNFYELVILKITKRLLFNDKIEEVFKTKVGQGNATNVEMTNRGTLEVKKMIRGEIL